MTFPKMVKILKPGKKGIAKIDHYKPTDLVVFQNLIRGQIADHEPVARLIINGRLMMSDGAYERRTNWEVLNQARGNVLIAGLGIGMILHPILAKPDVKRVVIIEKHWDVIDLVSPSLKKHKRKMEIICADIFEWRPERGTKFDCIYFDIWFDICGDNLKEMAQLHQAFKFFKEPGGYMDSWCRWKLLADRRAERRSGAYGYY